MTDLISREAAIAVLEELLCNGDEDYDIGYDKAIGDAIEALANMPSAESGWRPIETAPKDGTLFVGIAPTGAGHPYYMHPFVMRHGGKLYSSFQYNDGAAWKDWPASAPPSHWMPLPEFPA